MPDEAIQDDDTLPANTALAACCRSRREALEEGLVILAMNLPYWHIHQSGQHQLYVEADRLISVESELEVFREEQMDWHPYEADAGIQDRPASFYVPYLATLILIISFVLQRAYAPGYVVAGRMDAQGLMGRGEWWRPLTALFLHGDAGHLLGNLIFGLWYGTLVNRGYGTWLGWGLILLSGMLGNTLVGAIRYPDPHLALGASTAVFGALGLLVGEGLIHRWHQSFFSRLGPILVPLVAGGVLLGWTGGFDDPRTDGLAHALGFGSGLMLGIVAAFCLAGKESPLSQ